MEHDINIRKYKIIDSEDEVPSGSMNYVATCDKEEDDVLIITPKIHGRSVLGKDITIIIMNDAIDSDPFANIPIDVVVYVLRDAAYMFMHAKLVSYIFNKCGNNQEKIIEEFDKLEEERRFERELNSDDYEDSDWNELEDSDYDDYEEEN